MIRTVPLGHPLDGPLPGTAVPAAPAAAPTDLIAAFHHPNFTGVHTESGTVTAFVFQPPLSGFEDRPARPTDSYGQGLDEHQTAFLNAEYEAALAQWSRARLRRAVRSELAAAPKAWDKITQARAELDTAFDALRGTPDGQWRSMTMRLVDAQRAAGTAAKRWDEIAGRLAKAQELHDGDLNYLDARLMVRDVAAEAGVDAAAWDIRDYRDYFDREWPLPTRPMEALIGDAVDTQQQFLNEINDLVGRVADAPLHAKSA
jgi:hypothetical protein